MAKKLKETRVRDYLRIDPIHDQIDLCSHPLTFEIWDRKYRYADEATLKETVRRTVEGVYKKDTDDTAKWHALEAMEKMLFIPGGRIIAGAGTPNRVTLINCYVSRTIGDSMPDIMDALKEAALTQQQGGGIGMDFSTLRPAGATLHRTGAIASGPLHFMDMWDSMCATIKSAGGRRGAMMATLHCEHPDLPAFIEAKRQKGRLTNFNVSVLVTDAFMDAVKHDEDWYLGFHEPRNDGKHHFEVYRDDDDAIRKGQWYAYSKWKARDLWDLILKNTFDWAEPGVLFIDRINEENNLNYIEDIRCTNPCGEQPLPPYACCNLGAVNLARMVKNPFTPQASFDMGLLERVTHIGMRFLDNVIDVTLYPLPEQEAEELNKRRTGLGITGLANAMAQLGIRYNSPQALEFTEQVMSTLRTHAYKASAMLAAERGAFTAYNASRWGATSSVVKGLPPRVKALIKEHGIRNSVLLTIAPTGTTSILAGNVSSGLEPVFMHEIHRNVRQADESAKRFIAYDYGALLWHTLNGFDADLPAYMVDHTVMTPMDHLSIQAVCQKYVDASISKTINVPEDISYEQFREVYDMAYRMGCKGCTTYRPSDVRGAVLVNPADEKPKEAAPVIMPLLSRPEVLTGHTYKVSWPTDLASYYITINDAPDGRPFEIFIHSTSSKYTDWTTALSLMISAIMRRGDDITFIPQELSKVASAHDSGFVNQKYYASLVALIGATLEQHLFMKDVAQNQGESASQRPKTNVLAALADGQKATLKIEKGQQCPACGQYAFVSKEGCRSCMQCGYSTCG